MSEGVGGEKTEKATPKRRKDAREKGQVLKSTEVIAAASLLALFAAFKILGKSMVQQSAALLTRYLSGDVSVWYDALKPQNITGLFGQVLTLAAGIAAPILIIALLVGVLTNVAQVGFLFSTKALKPQMSRLNPLQGIKRLFSSRMIYELAKSIVKLVIIIVITYGAYQKYLGDYPQMMSAEILPAATRLFDIMLGTALNICIALLILSAADFGYQWWRYEKDLRMTKYEVKLELKQQEGDPQVKGKIKQKQRQIAMMRMMQAVPQADVVITNPTHYAIALEYDEGKSGAPVVLAKGKDYVAQKIKDIAREHNIEIVENKPVAQSLYSMCEVGGEIPLELYAAVAEILAYVYRLKNKRPGDSK